MFAYLLKRLFGAAFVFDMRGFWPDERVEGGAWRRGSVVYAVVKRLERVFLSNADVIVSLTHAGERIIRGFPYMQGRASRIAVIPTCTNLALFRPGGPPATKDGPGALIVGYVGSVTTWYMFDPVLTAFEMLRRRQPSARLRIVNRGQHAYIRERLGAHAIPDEVVELREASFADMAAEMATMDCGVFFIRPVFSKQASAPTKLGEFLACGIPCLTSSGVGDVQEILEPGRVGVVTAGTEPDQLRDGVERLLRLVEDPDTRERCVAAALEHFSLESGVAAYDRIYRSLTDHLEVPAGRVAEEDETAFDVPSPPAMTH